MSTNPAYVYGDDLDDTRFMLNNMCRPYGFWVGVHKHFDVTKGGGPFYVLRRKTHPDDRSPTLLRYATPQMITEFVNLHAENWTG